MIIAKQNKLLKQDINGIPFYITLIKHKIRKGKGLFSLKLNYIGGSDTTYYVFHYEELEIPKNITVKEWICLLFLEYHKSNLELQKICENRGVKEFLEEFKKQINIKNIKNF